jgi:hypothetical protein
MKHDCNPLLKSWNEHMKAAQKFNSLRRECRAFIASDRTAARTKKKARR